MNKTLLQIVLLLSSLLAAPALYASATDAITSQLDLTSHWTGITALIIFVIAYILVISEEFTQMRKSKPVIIAAGIIWFLVGLAYAMVGDTQTAGAAVRHNILEYAELFLFLLAAMTYINTMEERDVFNALRGWMVSKGFSLKTIFWLTGILAFVISPLADNLTTALIMASIVMSVGVGNPRFIAIACVNIVVAANAGGAFSPFGDITTLMVWQKGIVEFTEFFALIIPSIVNWIIPAVIMSFAIKKAQPTAVKEDIQVKPGGFVIIALFIVTIMMAVSFHSFLHLPPVLGMMTGLGLLKVYAYFINRYYQRLMLQNDSVEIAALEGDVHQKQHYDIFKILARAEWDTLLFFYGVILCVGGLGTIGYLGALSTMMYVELGPTTANILVGILSAIIDNIPVMFAVLTMLPDMSLNQWLLVTLTAGVGGSLLSIGSAAGVALMGQARGVYTFFSHLKWTWAIALGYAASIWVHLLINP